MQKVFLVFFVGVLGVFINNQVMNAPTVVNDVLLENVEALANTETTLHIACFWEGDFICPGTGKKVGEVYQGYGLRR